MMMIDGRIDSTMPNIEYRCYLTDSDDKIRAFEVLHCIDDAAALLAAQSLLTASTYRSAELWQRGRLVGKWDSADKPDKTDSSSNVIPIGRDLT